MNKLKGKTLFNGNVNPSGFCPYIQKVQEKVKYITVSYNGYEFRGVQNASEESLLIKPAYNTTSNGWCDHLMLQPGEVLIRVERGDAYNFSEYVVGTVIAE